MIQPPNSGPITGATSVVIAQMASAVPALALEKLDSSKACDSGIIGPGDCALQHAKDDQLLQRRATVRTAAKRSRTTRSTP